MPPKGEERLRQRQASSKPIVDAFFAWCDEEALKVLDATPISKAVGYARNQREALYRFLEDGRLPMTNNISERALRREALGRKNWLFSNTPGGAKASAIIYSIIETAKENDLNPLAYLTYLFEQLPNINRKDMAAVDLLLPWAAAVQAKFHVPSKSAR